MYLTYDEYVEMGGTITEADYPVYERRARALLDDWTLDRIKRLDEVPEEVKLAMFEVIEHVDEAMSVSDGISSFSNGVNSVSFDTGHSSAADLYDIVAAILPIELMSAAVSYNAR